MWQKKIQINFTGNCQTNFKALVDLLLYSKLAAWSGIWHTNGFQGNGDLDFTISHGVCSTTDLTNGNLGKLGAVFSLNEKKDNKQCLLDTPRRVNSQ